jgi:hypothetical protein
VWLYTGLRVFHDDNAVTDPPRDLNSHDQFLVTSSANDVWLVGATRAAQWNGGGWTPHDLPFTIDSLDLQGGWAAAPNDAWFVGHNGRIIHWDGDKFVIKVEGSGYDVPELHAISGLPDGGLWAVGDKGWILHRSGGR